MDYIQKQFGGPDKFLEQFGKSKKLYNIMPEGIAVIDSNLEVLDHTDHYHKLFGKSSPKPGNNLFIKDLYPENSLETVLSDTKNCLQSKDCMNSVYEFKTEKGKLTIERTLIPVSDEDGGVAYVVETVRDITHQMFSQDFILQSEYLYRKMIDSIPNVFILLLNEKTFIEIAEGPELRLLKIDRKQVEGSDPSVLFEGEQLKSINTIIELSFRGSTITNEMEYKGNTYYVQAVPLSKKEPVQNVMLVFENITQDKINEDVLKKAKLSAEKANMAKSEFLANMSHEIRTPLSSVVGFGDQLAKTRLDNKQQSYLDAIQLSSKHLLSIVNETLTLSQVESGEIQFELKPFKLNDIFNEVDNIMRIKAEKKQLNLSFYSSTRLNKPLLGDEGQLRQVIINLVNNAIKFTEKGKVQVLADILEESDEGCLVRIDVADTGIGIPANKQKAIFEEYYQDDTGITKKYSGSGLGLTISKTLVELQDGTLSVESEVGYGSTFSIIIPFKKTDAIPEQTPSDGMIEAEKLRGKKILLVDDDDMVRLLGESILEEWKVEFEMAVDGWDALDKLEDDFYDVILLDIHMPGISGMEVAKRLRARYQPGGRQPHILALTANVLKRDLEHFMEAGMDDYLTKPFREEELFKKIIRLLGYSRVLPPKKDEEKENIKVEKNGALFDLGELKQFGKGKKEFMEKMVNTFCKNSSSARSMMSYYLEKERWDELAGVAHKLLPSSKHLKVNSLIPKLDYIETNLKSDKPDYDLVKAKTLDVIEIITKVNKALKEHIA